MIPSRRALLTGAGASLIAALWLQLMLGGLILATADVPLSADTPGMILLILMLAIRGLLRLTVYILIGAMILQAVLSWINPYSPLAGPADQLTRPVLAPIRRFVPTIAGIDLSPLIAILLLQMALMFL